MQDIWRLEAIVEATRICKHSSRTVAAPLCGNEWLQNRWERLGAYCRGHEAVDAEDILTCPFYELFPEMPKMLVLQRLTFLRHYIEEGTESLERDV